MFFSDQPDECQILRKKNLIRRAYEKVCYPRNENVVGQTKADSKSFKRVYSEDRKQEWVSATRTRRCKAKNSRNRNAQATVFDASFFTEKQETQRVKPMRLQSFK